LQALREKKSRNGAKEQGRKDESVNICTAYKNKILLLCLIDAKKNYRL
jgi:hypothetical protein